MLLDYRFVLNRRQGVANKSGFSVESADAAARRALQQRADERSIRCNRRTADGKAQTLRSAVGCYLVPRIDQNARIEDTVRIERLLRRAQRLSK